MPSKTLYKKYYNLKKKEFNKLCSNFKHEKITDLVVAHKIEKQLLLDLRRSAMDYLKKCKTFGLANMTPNGKLMPKKEVQKEFNQVIQKYRNVINSLNFEKNIRNWVIPAIRYKEGKINKDNFSRNTRSELPHSDIWAGWSESAIVIQIPLFGDTKKNKVKYYQMPLDWNKNWIKKMTFDKGQKYFTSKCKEVNHHYKIGYVYICDILVVHRTSRLRNSKPRLSIDIPIITKSKKSINKNNLQELLSKKKMSLLGKKYEISCPVNMHEVKNTKVKYKSIN